MLAPWKEGYDKPRQHIEKQRHHFADKGLYSQSYGFSNSHVWMWELEHKEGWAPKNWCFELWWCRRLFRHFCTARRSNQAVLKEINPEYPLEGLMLKLKLQYFGHLMQRADSLEKTLMLGKTEGKKWSVWQRMRWLDNITNSMNMNFSKHWEIVGGQGSLETPVCGVAKSQTWLSNWTTNIFKQCSIIILWLSWFMRGL